MIWRLVVQESLLQRVGRWEDPSGSILARFQKGIMSFLSITGSQQAVSEIAEARACVCWKRHLQYQQLEASNRRGSSSYVSALCAPDALRRPSLWKPLGIGKK